MDFPYREIDSANFNFCNLELALKRLQESINLPLDVVFQTLLTDLDMVLFVKPLYHSVFNFAHSLQISEVFLEFITVRCHVLDSIVVTDIFLVWQCLKEDRTPFDR